MKTEHAIGVGAGAYLLWRLWRESNPPTPAAAKRRRARLGGSDPGSAGGLVVTGDALRDVGTGFERADSTDAPEGDGWALALVHDPSEDRSHVRVIDTARFEDEPVATLRFPEWVPMTFHGLWLPD